MKNWIYIRTIVVKLTLCLTNYALGHEDVCGSGASAAYVISALVECERQDSFPGFVGYVAVCVQLYCRCFTVSHLVSLFTLHVSAYMAIFKCVGCYYSHVLEGTCFAGFFCILHVVTLFTFPSLGWVKYEVLFMLF
jgi:hypothetical protein